MTKFSLAHLTVLHCAPPKMTYLAAQAGYDCVSYRLISRGMPERANYNLSLDKEMFRETKRALSDTGLSLNDIELVRIGDNTDVKEYESRIAVGAELGAKSILSSIWTSNYDFALGQFSKLCDIAHSYEMNVELEFVTYAAVNTLAQVVEILNTVKRENAGLLIDMLHFSRSKTDPQELKDLPREWFRMVHLCDAEAVLPETKEEMIHTSKRARQYVGEGGIDILSVLKMLPDDLVMSIELPNDENLSRFGEYGHISRCIESAKKLLGK